MKTPDLTRLAVPGAMIEVRVTPKASRNSISEGPEGIRIHVTAVPEDGRATAAAQDLLARALGVARTQLQLVRGAASRNKLFRLR